MASLVRSGVALHRPQTFAVSSVGALSCCLVRHVVSFGPREVPQRRHIQVRLVDAGVLEGVGSPRGNGNDARRHLAIERVIAAHEDGLRLSAAAGCYSAFVGFETFNPRNLLAATKVQNLEKQHRQRRDDDAASAAVALEAVKEKYRRVCRNWHRHGVAVHCGYMIGFPFDGPESGRQAAEWLLDVGVDLASFFVVTPLPGTEDHDRAVRECTIADRGAMSVAEEQRRASWEAQRGLVSAATSAAVDSAFNTLAHTVLVQNARTLEDLVREMLRPLLKSWLDDNLPGMVERLVRAEIERVSRGRS